MSRNVGLNTSELEKSSRSPQKASLSPHAAGGSALTRAHRGLRSQGHEVQGAPAKGWTDPPSTPH